jgi:hypothetical protein
MPRVSPAAATVGPAVTRLTEDARLARVAELQAAFDAGEEPAITVAEYDDLFPPTLEQLRAMVDAASLGDTLPNVR